MQTCLLISATSSLNNVMAEKIIKGKINVRQIELCYCMCGACDLNLQQSKNFVQKNIFFWRNSVKTYLPFNKVSIHSMSIASMITECTVTKNCFKLYCA